MGFGCWYKHSNFVFYSANMHPAVFLLLILVGYTPYQPEWFLLSVIKALIGPKCEQTQGMLGRSLTHWTSSCSLETLDRWEKCVDVVEVSFRVLLHIYLTVFSLFLTMIWILDTGSIHQTSRISDIYLRIGWYKCFSCLYTVWLWVAVTNTPISSYPLF